jgi:hypothetical protein
VGISGCAAPYVAPLKSVPSTAADVDFDSTARGQINSWRYERRERVHATDQNALVAAGVAALERSGFKVKKNEGAAGVLVGEHAATTVDWNIVAGFYFVPAGSGEWKTAVIVETSRDSVATAARWEDLIYNALFEELRKQ